MLYITFFISSVLFVFHYRSISKKTSLSRLKHFLKKKPKCTVRLIKKKKSFSLNKSRWESFSKIFSLLQAYFLLTLVTLHALV